MRFNTTSTNDAVMELLSHRNKIQSINQLIKPLFSQTTEEFGTLVEGLVNDAGFVDVSTKVAKIEVGD